VIGEELMSADYLPNLRTERGQLFAVRFDIERKSTFFVKAENLVGQVDDQRPVLEQLRIIFQCPEEIRRSAATPCRLERIGQFEQRLQRGSSERGILGH
jgi:hypothetical protein